MLSVFILMLLYCVCVCFFFSSRRRHTRLVSDWSSDVCSSDLMSFEHDSAERLRGSRIRMALRAATQSLCTVVLKGHRSVIASPTGYVWINSTGNPGMAKGGSGDVLSGIVAGLLAQRAHFFGMVGWTARADPDQDIGEPELQGIFHK